VFDYFDFLSVLWRWHQKALTFYQLKRVGSNTAKILKSVSSPLMIKVRLVKTNTSQRLHRSSWGDNMSEVLEQTSLEKVLTHY